MDPRIKVEDVNIGDTVLRYGMWFEVENVEIHPADRGGDLYVLSLKPATTRIPSGVESTLALFPGETITKSRI